MPEYEPGVYLFRPEHLGMAKWKDKVKPDGRTERGKPYLFIEGVPERMGIDGAWVDVESPSKQTIFFTLGGGAFDISMRQLEMIGFNGDFNAPALSEEFVNGFNVECVHETREGKTYTKWRIYGAGGMQHETLDSGGIRELNELWKAKHPGKRPPPNAAKPRPGRPRSPQVPPDEMPPTGDDIPFDVPPG